MIPRDPDRIDRMIELLRQAWHASPDMRLTQLIINVSDIHHDCGPIYYLEDTEMEANLHHEIEAQRRRSGS